MKIEASWRVGFRSDQRETIHYYDKYRATEDFIFHYRATEETERDTEDFLM